jgi:uncharacterized protein YkwD
MSAKTTAAARRPRRPARVLLVLAAMIGSLLVPAVVAAPAAQAMTTLEASWSGAVFTMINSERAAHGLRPLVRVWNLNSSGRTHNRWMQKYNTMSHQLPGEPWLGKRETNAGYYWTYCGENIGWNSSISLSGVKALQSMMYNEKAPYDGHRLNILSTHFANVGVDVLIDYTNHKVWLTTDFGHH